MTDTLPEPPGTLGKAGARLWNSITAEFQVDDVAGKELLFQACSASDRLEQLREAIERDGVTVDGKPHPLLASEATTRGFVCRTLATLGLASEPLRAGPGRPPGRGGAIKRGEFRMPPKRTPIARPRRVAGVPPEAIDAARRLRGLDGPVPEGHDYQEARAVIRRAFGIAPWQIHPLDVDGADPPEWLAPRRDDVKRDRACELRRQLDEALTS